jgi:hypothetical protein
MSIRIDQPKHLATVDGFTQRVGFQVGIMLMRFMMPLKNMA